MTNSFFAEFDALAHEAFAAAGMGAGTGAYTAPGGATSTPRIYVNRTMVAIGEFQQQTSPAVTVQYFLADVMPETEGVVVVGADTWINVQETDNDGSLSTWIVRRG